MAYEADQLQLPRLVIERSLFRFLRVRSLRELMPLEFVGVIRHLLDLTGCPMLSDFERGYVVLPAMAKERHVLGAPERPTAAGNHARL